MSKMFDRIERQPAYRQVFSAIEAKILGRNLRPGDTLPSETLLADQFGLNRSTIREGLRQLEMSGLIERRNNSKRLFVTIPRKEDLATAMSKAMALNDITFQEVWEAMMLLEPQAAELAASRANAEQLVALEDKVEQLEANINDDEQVVEHCADFFLGLAEATNNHVLVLSLAPLALLLRPSLKIMIGRLDQARYRILEAQENVVDACVEGDAIRAKEWMEKHIIDFRRGYSLAGIDLSHVVM